MEEIIQNYDAGLKISRKNTFNHFSSKQCILFCSISIYKIQLFSVNTQTEKCTFKKKVEIYSHTFWRWLWGCRAKHTRLGETRRDSNTKKRIRMFFFEYAHDAFSYFQGQISKLSFKFCFAGYSFPFISWSPVSTGISFVNRAETFEVCL